LWFGIKEILHQFTLTRDLAWYPSLDGISWTLEIEIKFYILCALQSRVIVSAHLPKFICSLILLGILEIAFTHTIFTPLPSSEFFKAQLTMPLYGIVHALAMSMVFILYMMLGVLFNWHCRALLSSRQLVSLITLCFFWFILIWYESDFKTQWPIGPLNYFLALVLFSLSYFFRNKIRAPKILIWLGDISYPLYAIHPILGYGLLYWLIAEKQVPSGLALGLTISIILILATALHYMIELPSNEFGKHLAKNLTVKHYLRGIWAARFFWVHLAMADLRSKWRRSFIGAFWSILQPLGMTILLSIVFSHLFHVNITLYAPYILSGIIIWEFIGASLTGGALAFVQADAYIKQCKHPLSIYTLRLILSHLVILGLASIVLWVWTLAVLPHNFGWHWLSILTFFPLIAIVAWPLSTLLAYMGTRFRDIPHAMGLILQIVWFISPVYFEANMFRNGGLNGLVDYNPVYHLLQIIRAPLLEGKWPTLQNYLFCIATALVFTILAIVIGRKAESKVIFYL
jgi:lipopolysaccharide transport system permease protein